MPDLSFSAARSRLANLSKTRSADHPEIAELRCIMRQQFVVLKVAQALEKGPELTSGMRNQIVEMLDARLVTDAPVA